MKKRDKQETDELPFGPEHHSPLRDQAVWVDDPWQAEDGHPGYPHTCDQGRPGSDADEEESKEETKSKENKQLDKENAIRPMLKNATTSGTRIILNPQKYSLALFRSANFLTTATKVSPKKSTVLHSILSDNFPRGSNRDFPITFWLHSV